MRNVATELSLTCKCTSSPLWRGLGLGCAGGIVSAATHDHLGVGRGPGDHCERCENCATDGSAYNVPRGLYGGMQVAQGLTHLEQGQRSTGVGQTDSLRGTNRLRAIARTGRLVGAFGSRQYLDSVLGMDGWMGAVLDAGMRRGIIGRRLVRCDG
jgi:hypothetical protein